MQVKVRMAKKIDLENSPQKFHYNVIVQSAILGHTV